MGACYLQVENLSKSYGDRLLFSDISFGLEEGDKVGLVARNGVGKSTLLNILADKESPDSGRIVWRNGVKVGFLEQTPECDPELSVIDYTRPGHSCHDEGEIADGYERAKRLLSQFGLTDIDQKVESLSGGEFKRAALAKVLLTEPDILILDEPTNHLDIEIVEWLEKYLQRKRITLLLVTHDRWTLDKVCSRIIEIDNQTLYSYDGNYDYYLRRRTERMESRELELARVRNLLRGELEWMRRQPQARGSKAKYRIDNFYDLKQRSIVGPAARDVALDVKAGYIGSKILEIKNLSKAYGDKKIISDWEYTFARYEKVGIVGPNGIGKSTFIKMLMGLLSPDSGTIETGSTVKWGYYSQEGITGFDANSKVIDAVKEITDRIRIDEKTTLTASQFLNRFLFSPADQQKFISKLSGGERRRLYLATVLMREPNFLVLDEPTNDLDIMTLAILEDYLANFKGCVMVVSHDRYFLDRVADHLFVLEGDGKLRDFPGDYSTYRHCVAQEAKDNQHTNKKGSGASSEENKGNSASSRRLKNDKPKLSFKERREMEDLEICLEKLNSERAEMEKVMTSGELSHLSFKDYSIRFKELVLEIDEAEMRYLELLDKES